MTMLKHGKAFHNTSQPDQAVEQTVKLAVIWEALTLKRMGA